MPAKKKSKSALTKRSKVSQISRKAGNLGKAAAQYTRALRAKGISLAKKMELLEKRAEAYKVLGKLKEQAADLEKIAALQKTQIEDNISAAKQSRAELEILSSIAQALVDQADYRRIGQIVGEKVQAFFDAEIAGIGLYDEEAGMITVPYYYERGKLKEVPPFKYGEGVTSHVLKTRKALYLPTAKEAEKYNVIYTAELPSETMLMAPILVGKKALGTLTIQHSQPHAYGKHELKILTSIANSMAVAIENARLFDETTQRNAELAVINSVQQGLSSSLKFQEIIDLVGEKVGEIFNADTVFAGLYDAARDWGTHVYYVDGGKRVPVLDGPVIRPSLAAHVADTKKPLLLGTKEEGAKLGAIRVVRRKAEEDRNESVLGVPIMKGESVIGGISVQSYKRNAYTKNHLRLLETLASSMSVALQNAQLFDETSQRNAELAVINSVQESMAKQLDIKGIYEAVGEKIKDIFNAQSIILRSFDHVSGRALHYYVYEKGERFYPDSSPFSGLMKHLISTKETEVINEDMETKTKEFGMTVFAGTEATKSGIWVPLVASGTAIGAISLQNVDHENAFSASDVRLLETLANSMSVALENARLFDETSQRNAELAVINSVQEAMAKQLDIRGIYEAVGEKIKDIFQPEAMILGAFDLNSSLVFAHYFYEKGERFFPEPFPFSGLIKHLVSTQKSVVINENFDEKKKEFGMRTVAGGDTTKSALFVPLVAGNKVIGGISLQSDHENAFSASDVRLLETLANGMSVALENARLFDETGQRNAELAVINSVQDAMAKQLDIKSIYEAVGEQIKNIFNAQVVDLERFDHSSGLSVSYFAYEKGERFYPEAMPFGGISRHLIATKQTILINADMAERGKEFGSVIVEGTESPKSGLWVPLVTGNNVAGFISLQNVDRENAFSASDVRLLETIANSMSVALENARLFDETAQRNAELAVINSVQEAVAKQMDIQGIYEAVGEKFKDIFDAQTLLLATLDAAPNLLVPRYVFERGHRLYPGSIPPSSFSAEAMNTRKTILINQGLNEELKARGIEPQDDWGELPKSAIYVPLISRDTPIGIISLQNLDRENVFSATDVRLLETLANSMSIALENARLFDESNRLLDESRKKEEELSTVNTVSQAVASELELASLIELIGVQVRKIFKADIAYLALYDQEKDLIEFPYIFGDTLEPLKLGEGITSQVIQGGKPVLINRDEAWKEAEQKIERVGTKSLSYLGVPILVGKRAIGAISVQSTQKAGRFDEEDQHLLSTIAANVGAAIENARLFAEVARQKKYFETFFQYSPAAVVVVDFNGNVISWNPAAEGLFGYSAQEAIGRNVDDLVANDPQIQAEARSYTKRATDELGRVEVIGRRTRKDGSFVDVEVKALPISVEGTMFGLLVIYHDISEIEQARRAAEEANQAKSAFLANMSHELRTPLNAIIGFTRIVRRKGEEALPEKQLENLDKVLVSAEHLLGLINTILDIAKIEAGRMELQISDFSLAALVDGCLATSQPLAKPGVRLLSSLPPDLPQVHSDEEKIRQVLLNLLSNAAKFTRDGSIQVIGEVKGERISLAVQDSGIGIAPENLHKIFEEFQQADNTTTREYGGTGLGLSISRSLAKLLGGDLTVSSVEGQGSTFTLTIPMHLGPVAAVVDGKEEMAAPRLEPDKPIVLVIDDQPDMFHILQQNLGDAGYQVVGALSGEEGIEKARSLHPFAITLDIMMPRKDGWQVLYELKNDPQTKDIPVIILTIVDNKPMGFRLGASDYLVKPLNEKSVLDALRRLAKSNGGVGPRKLLVVDDDPKVVDMVQQMLDGEGFAIESAADGVEALTHLKGNQPDAILLDLLMPRMDGFQLIDEIHKQPRLGAIPIIVLTAKSLSNEEQAQLEKSVASIVQKQGLGSETLIKEIHQIVS